MESVLSIVEDVFEIEGRGCVIVPGIPLDTKIVVKVRDPIRLARPDGSSVSTYVAGIEMILVSPPGPHPIPILLRPDFHKADVSSGTVVYVNQPGT